MMGLFERSRVQLLNPKEKLGCAEKKIALTTAGQCSNLPQQTQLVIAVPSFHDPAVYHAYDDDALNANSSAGRRNAKTFPGVSPFQSHAYGHTIILRQDVINTDF